MGIKAEEVTESETLTYLKLFLLIMRIAVNQIALQEDGAKGKLIEEAFARMAHQNPQHEFILFYDGDTTSLQFPPNASFAIMPAKPKTFLPLISWLNVKVPLAVKKHKPDIFITTDLLPGLSSIPQILILDDLRFLRYPQLVPKYLLLYQKLYMRQALKKAKAIITGSEFFKRLIAEKFSVPKNKITIVAYPAGGIYKRVEWEERETIKEKYAEGYEYFLFMGSIDAGEEIINILKAFSLFKVRQRSGIKLLIFGERGVNRGGLSEKLKTYKFRDEIKLHEDLTTSEQAKVMASAYALVCPATAGRSKMPVVEAMQSGVPVITSAGGEEEEIGANAVLYANPNDPADLTEHLKVIFKDETLRSKLIERGLLRAAEFTWDKTVATFHRLITATVTK